MTSTRKPFVGAHIPEELASGISLVSLTLGISRAEIIRDALTKYVGKIDKAALIDRLSTRLLADWHLQQANHGKKASKNMVKEFCDNARQRLSVAGISDILIKRVINRLEFRLSL